jgi:aspartate/methionine/tyrosine aminotransferase
LNCFTYFTEGAFYFTFKLPEGIEEIEAVEYLANKWGVLTVPCTSCGVKGWIRVSYGNMEEKDCKIASERLKNGLKSILQGALTKNK